MKSIAIFASGKGSNAKNIIQYFKNNNKIKIALIVASHRGAGVLDIATEEKIPSYILDKKEYFGTGEQLQQKLMKYNIDGIVLAGFHWLIPLYLIENFPHKIINIHPALLPKYGGKGMYGMHVHDAVWKNKEKITGITVHEVNAKYDEGQIVFQASTTIDPMDMPLEIAQKVHILEYKHFPMIIENYFSKI